MPIKVAVVIPVYKETLNEFEKISLAQVQKILGHYQIIFVAPQGLRIPYAKQDNKTLFFPPQFFQSTRTYNYLMMSPAFYQAFLEYEYILIHQLDAFVFSDKLEYFCSLEYDNIGAPWYPAWKFNYSSKGYRLYVGNGGFCLRKVKTFYDLLSKHKTWSSEVQRINEDIFFALCGKLFPDEFRVAPINVAYTFSTEFLVERFMKKNGGELPFGCHGWHRYGANVYIKEISKFGYDLSSLENQMGFNDVINAESQLKNYAIQRLHRRIQRGQSLTRYLPKNKFSSIRVVRHPVSIMIFVRLMLENPTLSDEIVFYNEDEQDILIQDLKLARSPHLLITTGGGK